MHIWIYFFALFFIKLSLLASEYSEEGGKQEAKGAQKDTEEPKIAESSPHKFTGSVSFLSDYRSRGISQTMRRPAIQGELKYTHASGFYFKSWASNVDGTTHYINNASMEWDFYMGIELPICQSALKYDFGFIYYYYPGGEALVPERVSYNTLEYYLGIIYKNFNIKFYQTLTDYYGVNSSNPPFNWSENRFVRPHGGSQGSPYIEANYEWLISLKWKAGFHVGYQAVINYPQLNYIDWQASLTYKFDWFDLSFFYIDTNAKHDFYDVPDNSYKRKTKDLGGATLVVSVTRSF